LINQAQKDFSKMKASRDFWQTAAYIEAGGIISLALAAFLLLAFR